MEQRAITGKKMGINNQEELQLMLRIARLYYEDGLTQQKIADELGLGRPTVSRLLMQARHKGIVRINIVDPFATSGELEEQLVKTFGLRRGVVVAGEGLTGEQLRRRLGFATAEYLRHNLSNGMQIGIGWGRTLHAVVEALHIKQQTKICVFPLLGGLGQISASFQVNELARRLAEAFGGTWQPLYIPAFIENAAALEALLRLADVESVIRAWSHLDLALIGIGNFALQRQSSMLFASYISDKVLQELELHGAVGDICGRFFDAQGQPCSFESGVIGISLEQLRSINHVIGVAGGEEKVSAILGALRGGYVDVLVTDTVTARAVLEKDRTENSKNISK